MPWEQPAHLVPNLLERGRKARAGSSGGHGPVCTVSPSPKSHRGSSILQQLSLGDLGEAGGSQPLPLWGEEEEPSSPRSPARRRRAGGRESSVLGCPHSGHTHTHEHPRLDLAPEGPEEREGRRGFPSALRGGAIRFSRCLPGGERGLGSTDNPGVKNGANCGRSDGKRERRVRGASRTQNNNGRRRRKLRSPEHPGVPSPEPPPSSSPRGGFPGWNRRFGNLPFYFPSLEAER